jgi:hypothetical protein
VPVAELLVELIPEGNEGRLFVTRCVGGDQFRLDRRERQQLYAHDEYDGRQQKILEEGANFRKGQFLLLMFGLYRRGAQTVVSRSHAVAEHLAGLESLFSNFDSTS